MHIKFAVLALLFTHGLATAGGYQAWQFGMNKEQVKAVGDTTRYYTFKNGDIGAGHVPFEDGEALLSFYFKENSMERVMLIAYMGEDDNQARHAWSSAYAHLARVCGDVESRSAGEGAVTLEAAMRAYDNGVPQLATMERHQMGCLHMPAGERIWASATRGFGKQIMVAVNYGKP